jgi:hypothetical protein
MEHHVGIDVSLELSSLCLLDATAKERHIGEPVTSPRSVGRWLSPPTDTAVREKQADIKHYEQCARANRRLVRTLCSVS